jgi:hypothetical protein
MPGLAPLGEYLRYAVTLTAVLDPFFAVQPGQPFRR